MVDTKEFLGELGFKSSDYGIEEGALKLMPVPNSDSFEVELEDLIDYMSLALYKKGGKQNIGLAINGGSSTIIVRRGEETLNFDAKNDVIISTWSKFMDTVEVNEALILEKTNKNSYRIIK